MSTAAPVAAGPRPVTPLGIAAALLESVESRLAGPAASGDAADPDVRADLARARALVAGLDPYVAACTSPESPALTALHERTAAEDWLGRREPGGPALEQEMLSGHVEGVVLRFLAGMTGARRVLEVGMFTGYSALALAEALPEDGRVVACELDAGVAAFAQESFAASPAGHRIEVRVGPGAETLAALTEAGERFDLVFVDADKPGYAAYVDAVLGAAPGAGLLADGGLLCLDNTLLQGEPWTAEAASMSENARAIAEVNQRLVDDPRVEQVLLPLRDGLTLVRRA